MQILGSPPPWGCNRFTSLAFGMHPQALGTWHVSSYRPHPYGLPRAQLITAWYVACLILKKWACLAAALMVLTRLGTVAACPSPLPYISRCNCLKDLVMAPKRSFGQLLRRCSKEPLPEQRRQKGVSLFPQTWSWAGLDRASYTPLYTVRPCDLLLRCTFPSCPPFCWLRLPTRLLVLPSEWGVAAPCPE